MEAMTDHPDQLSNPALGAVAWRRYWRMMRWMVLAAIATVLAALYYLHVEGGLVSIHMVIATAAGVGLTVLLGTGLMLLSFMSSGSGHDEDVAAAAEAIEAEGSRHI